VIRLILGALLLATPALAQSRATCEDHREAIAALTGKTEAEARAALARMPGVRTIRLLAPNQPATMDLRPDRVTGLVRDGRVAQIGCG
jgi:hypothetical protein